jgi:hypothetical protein
MAACNMARMRTPKKLAKQILRSHSHDVQIALIKAIEARDNEWKEALEHRVKLLEDKVGHWANRNRFIVRYKGMKAS